MNKWNNSFSFEISSADSQLNGLNRLLEIFENTLNRDAPHKKTFILAKEFYRWK